MRMILQRVRRAVVRVDGEEVGAIGRGMLVYAGIEGGDTAREIAAAAEKLVTVRLFEDDRGRMNLDSAAAEGAFLIVSQFTLAGHPLARGRRPSFDGAAAPEVARGLIDQLVAAVRGAGFEVASGRFGAKMEVESVNDGPVTFVLDLGAPPPTP